MAFVFSGYFLVNTFIKWQYEPDIGIRKEMLNVRKIPFPAVTICPQTKTKMEFFSFRNTYKRYWEHFKLYGTSDINAARFESMLHVCDPELSYRIQLNESKVCEGPDIVKTLKEISYSVDDAMLFCKFRKTIRDCTSLFIPIITENGICYSFNMLNHKEMFHGNILSKDFDNYHHSKNSSWSLDSGYETDDLNAYPSPVISQEPDSLRVILKTTDIDLDYVCHGSKQGFKIYIHRPGDISSIIERHLFLPIKHDATVSLTATATKVSANLKSYKPQQRKWYFTDEKPLQFFKFYTKSSCYLECLTNYTFKYCGCVKFSMPRTNSTKICDYTQINCTVAAKQNLMLLYNTDQSEDCDCLASCTNIHYAPENFQTEFEYKRLFNSFNYELDDMPG